MANCTGRCNGRRIEKEVEAIRDIGVVEENNILGLFDIKEKVYDCVKEGHLVCIQ